MDIYEYTGNRRYLEPIPKCLDWLDSATSPDGSIGIFLEEGTNRPLGAMYVGDSGSYDSIQITYDLSKSMGGYGFVRKNFSTKRERERYEKITAVPWQKPPEQPSLPKSDEAFKQAAAMEKNVRRIIDALDEHGRWTEDGRLYSKRFYYKNEPEYAGPVMKSGWIRTGTFLRNMNTLSRYVNLMKNAR